MAKRRDIFQQRRGRLAQRNRRRQWMARIILVGLTGMLALSITLTLWPPMLRESPDETTASADPNSAPDRPANEQPLPFASGSLPPGFRTVPDTYGWHPPAAGGRQGPPRGLEQQPAQEQPQPASP